MTGFKCFSVTTNFFIPTEIVNILKKFGAFYDKKHKEWTVHINKYKEVALEVKNFCQPRGIFFDLIPQMVFDICEYRVPFSAENIIRIINYDYHEDLENKPSIQQLPKHLLSSLYNFQKVGV